MSAHEYEKTGGKRVRYDPTHRALDGQVLSAIDRRAYGDEVFVPRLRAQGLQRQARERIDELVCRKLVPEGP
jgi:hypothetical protein